jgi:hypothetical protein
MYIFYYQEVDMPSLPYVFSQFLDLLPRYEFQSIVNNTREITTLRNLNAGISLLA